MENKIKVLIVEPGKYPIIKEIDNDLDSLQDIVDGNIETYYPFDNDSVIICNEEGKIEGLPPNRAIYDEKNERIIEVICGTFLVAYAPWESEDFESLPEELMGVYLDRFKYPEMFFRLPDGEIVAQKFEPIGDLKEAKLSEKDDTYHPEIDIAER